jgi:Tol biopolymer transport system component
MDIYSSLRSTIVILLAGFISVLVINSCDSGSTTDESPSSEESTEQLGPHPLRFSHVSIRTEKYLLPAVSTGPLEPDWSPDGEWITFSMRGDIWKIPPTGGEAVGLTEGPEYYFEPAWSPDGESIAFTVDLGERYGIGIMDTEGGQVKHVITDSRINIQPEWSADGESLYFVSDRESGLSIFEFIIDTGTIESVVAERGNQIQPSVSPDGESLAYIARPQGLPGSGGVWIKTLSTGEENLIHYEETRHRAAPEWSADGQSLYYVSEVTGTNDIGIIPANEGAPVWITHDEGDELSPAVSAGGEQLAFVSNRKGPTQLFTMSANGGPESDWSEVEISSLEPNYDSGQLRIQVVDSEGNPTPARIYMEAADGRSYAPETGFHRVVSVGEQHYFHTDGTDTLTVPAGKASIEAIKGFEYEISRDSVEVTVDDIVQVTLSLERMLDTAERDWYSGETHAHDLHGGRYGLNHEDFFTQLQAEDLNVTNALIHRDGTQLMGRWEDLTGNPHPLSTEEHILQYGEEFRGSRGHIGLLGISEFVMPLVGGEGGTAYSAEVLNSRYIDEANEQGGIAGFMHPYGSRVEEPADGSYSEIPVDVALGKGSFYDVLSIPYDAFDNAEMYYRLLNSGFKLAATGGSDNFADVWRDPPAGTDRTYALVDGSLNVDSWLESVKAGKTFATNGPLLFMNVEDQLPGGEISLSGEGPDTLSVQGEVYSIAPLNNVDILLNGVVVDSINIRDKELPVEFATQVAVPENGWIAARAYGPYNQYLTDSYPFAQTTPVYVLRNGQRYTSTEDAMFLHDVVEAFWQSVNDRNNWENEAEKENFFKTVEEAKEVYRDIAEGNYTFDD